MLVEGKPKGQQPFRGSVGTSICFDKMLRFCSGLKVFGAPAIARALITLKECSKRTIPSNTNLLGKTKKTGTRRWHPKFKLFWDLGRL